MRIQRLLKYAWLVALMVAGSFEAFSQNPDFITEIQRDSLIVIVQSDAIAKKLVSKQNMAAETTTGETNRSETVTVNDDVTDNLPNQKVAGFRVQVFSDNNSRTAKVEARTKATSISERFPHYKTYVTYEAPYWRLRVGDFRSRIDAEQAADEIKAAFPSYSREVRVVKDRIYTR